MKSPSARQTGPRSTAGYGRLIAHPLVLALILGGIAARRFAPSAERWYQERTRMPVVAAPPVETPIAEREPKREAPLVAAPPATSAPALDLAAIARANELLEAARRDRARGEARRDDARKRMEAAAYDSARRALAARTLPARVRDQRARFTRANANGQAIKLEVDQLKKDVDVLGLAPQVKAKPLLTKNPVAKPTRADEFHFEVRRNKVAYINLDRLMEMVQADMRDKLRQAPVEPAIVSKVGPVGAFSLRYILERTSLDLVDAMATGRRVPMQYQLSGWELVPTFDSRGEDYNASRSEISDYALAVRKLSPNNATITMWVYPDSFGLYRKLRDDLHDLGFTVAARPLPEGVPIRASASGTVSAGQ